jgi:hypothetical protein
MEPLVAPSRVRKVMSMYLNGDVLKLIEAKKAELAAGLKEFNEVTKKLKEAKNVLEFVPKEGENPKTKEETAAANEMFKAADKRLKEIVDMTEYKKMLLVQEEKQDLGRIKIKFSNHLSNILSRFFEFSIEEILRNSFKNVLDANRKMVDKNHLVKNAELLKTYSVFCNLPAWVELVNDVKNEEESGEKDKTSASTAEKMNNEEEPADGQNTPNGSVGSNEEVDVTDVADVTDVSDIAEINDTTSPAEENKSKYFFTYITKIYKNIVFNLVKSEGENEEVKKYVHKEFFGIKVRTSTKEFLSLLIFQMIKKIANSIIVMKNFHHLNSFSVGEDLLKCVLAGYIIQLEDVEHTISKRREKSSLNALNRYNKKVEKVKENGGSEEVKKPTYLKEEDIPMVQCIDYNFMKSNWDEVGRYINYNDARSANIRAELDDTKDNVPCNNKKMEDYMLYVKSAEEEKKNMVNANNNISNSSANTTKKQNNKSHTSSVTSSQKESPTFGVKTAKRESSVLLTATSTINKTESTTKTSKPKAPAEKKKGKKKENNEESVKTKNNENKIKTTTTKTKNKGEAVSTKPTKNNRKKNKKEEHEDNTAEEDNTPLNQENESKSGEVPSSTAANATTTISPVVATTAMTATMAAATVTPAATSPHTAAKITIKAAKTSKSAAAPSKSAAAATVAVATTSAASKAVGKK